MIGKPERRGSWAGEVMERAEEEMGQEGLSRQRDVVSRVKNLWRREGCPDAVSFLAEHATLRENRSLVMELAYEEYCLRRDQGESIDASVFCRRFPSISRSLARQIEVDEYVRADPTILLNQKVIEWPRRGDLLFGFTVVEEIGRGAFARAYLCAESGLGNRHVVVKVSHGGTAEADTLGSLNHPNIMTVHSVQMNPETRITGICMPFCGRSTLYDVIDVAFAGGKVPQWGSVILEGARALARRGDHYWQSTTRVPLRPRAPYITGVLQIGVQLADALAHSHERGVLHGDLKPSNIVMSIEGTPLIVDFNLSQTRDSKNFVTGGTLPYMAPEQIRSMLLGADDEDRVDERSDIFSLAAILHEMLTGTPPFGSVLVDENPMLMAGQMLDEQNEGPPPASAHNRNVPKELSELICRCLSFDPAVRPASMRQVEQELRRQLSLTRRAQRYLRQRRGVTTSILLTGLACAGGFVAWQKSRPPLRDRYFRQGVAAYHSGDYFAALELLSLSIQEDNTFGPAYLARGCAGLAQWKITDLSAWCDDALSDASKAVRFCPTLESHELRAYCLIRKHEYAMAKNELTQMADRGESNAAVYNNLAYCDEKMIVETYGNGGPDHRAEIDHRRESYLLESMRRDDQIAAPRVTFAILELQRYRSDEQYVPIRGLEAIRGAARQDLADSGTYYFAAKLAAAVLKSEQAHKTSENECLHYIELAIKRGHPPHDFFPPTVSPLDVLAGNANLAQIVNSTRVEGVQAMIERVIEPHAMNLTVDGFVEFASRWATTNN